LNGETKIKVCEVKPQAVRTNTEFLMKRAGPKAPTAIHGPLGLKFLPLGRAKASAD